MPRPKSNRVKENTTANLGFETKLWLAADKLRNNMDAAEYKHVVLGLIFLKYISDTFDTITTSRFAGTSVLLARKELLIAFDKQVTPLFLQVHANLHQSRTVATLRDTLLAKVLSGELTVT